MKLERLGVLLIIGIGVVACDSEDAFDPFADDQLSRMADEPELAARAQIRELKLRYGDPEDALADGYVALPPCLEGFGLHFAQPENFLDGVIDPDQPETLRYAPNEEGEMKLVAIEYSSPTTHPMPDPLFDAPFEGPAETGVPGFPPIYYLTLSVRHNPDGLFTTFNPKVACRGTGVALAFEPCVHDPEIQCLVPSTCEAIGATACVEWERSQP